MRKGEQSDRYRHAALAAQLAYCSDPPKSQADIANELDMDRATVSRLLKFAREKGIVTFSLNLPVEETLANELARRYKLAKAWVVPIPALREDKNGVVFRRLLAEAAAKYLEGGQGLIQNSYAIGLGCGATMRDVIAHLTYGKYERISVSQLTVETYTDQALDESPLTLVGMLYAKWWRDSTAHAIQPLPESLDERYVEPYAAYEELRSQLLARAQAVDTAVLGIGVSDAEGGGSFSRIYQASEITNRDLERLGAVGEMCNRPYDEKGNDLFPLLAERFPKLKCYTDGVDLGLLGQLVTHQKRVVAVAGGPHKCAAIAVALQNGFVNHLVTDKATAEAILGEA